MSVHKKNTQRLRRKLGATTLRNPVIAASGTFGYGDELAGIFDVDILGGFVTKTITVRARQGNPPPRIYDLGFGVINSIGLHNPGLREFLKQYVPFFKRVSTAVFVSIYGETATEWTALIRALDKERIAGFELNFSCPNIHGRVLSAQTRKLAKLCGALRKITRKTLLVKVAYSPDLDKTASILHAQGVDGMVLINTLPAMVYEASSGRAILGNVYGGLSGPCIKPVALRCVHQVAQGSNIPLIGCGGIMNAQDAVEFLAAGASCVQVGTATLSDPGACKKIVKGLEKKL